MANHIFGLNVDFNRNETLKQRIENLITAPTVAAPDAGYIYFNTATGYPYLWNGSVWYNLAIGTSTVWRKSDGVTPADSYTEQVHHAGKVVLNGVGPDAAYQTSMGSTYIAGTLGITGNIQSENVTSWLTISGNQGVALRQINQNVGFVQIGNDTAGAMAPQANDYNTRISRAWSAGVQDYDPNFKNIFSAGAVNYTNVTSVTRTFTSLYIAPTALTNVTEHIGIDTNGLIRFRDYNADVTKETAVRALAVGANGWVVTTALGGGGGTGLEALDEGLGTGWRLVGRNPAEFGNIGLNAVDFGWYLAKATGGALGTASFNIGADNTASGQNSVTFGYNNTASAYDSYTFGDSNTASNTYTFAVGSGNASSNYGSISFGESNISSGAFSFASGYDNTASGYLAFAHGWQNTVPGGYSMALGVYNNINDLYSGAVGLGLDVQSPHSFFVGTGNTIYTNTTINQANTRLFGVGNGTVVAGTPNTVGVRSDAFLVFWDGRVLAPSLTTAVINAEATGKVLITREWFESKPRKYAVTIGDTTTTEFTINHALGTTDVIVQIYNLLTKMYVDTIVESVDSNNVKVSFYTAPFTNEYRVIVKS